MGRQPRKRSLTAQTASKLPAEIEASSVSPRGHPPLAPEPSEGVENEFNVALLGTTELDLVELRVWPPRQGHRGTVFALWCDLRFAEEVVITENWRVVVRLDRAELAARFVGCAVAPGTRLGDEQLPTAEVTTERETEITEHVGSAEASGRFGVGIRGLVANLSAHMAGKAKRRRRTLTERKGKIIAHRVAALTNNRWEIREPSGSLRGTYLRAPATEDDDVQPLCLVVTNSKAFGVRLTLEVRPDDLNLDVTPIKERHPWGTKETQNKRAIAKRLTEKAGTTNLGRLGDERVALACAFLQGNERARIEEESNESL